MPNITSLYIQPGDPIKPNKANKSDLYSHSFPLKHPVRTASKSLIAPVLLHGVSPHTYPGFILKGYRLQKANTTEEWKSRSSNHASLFKVVSSFAIFKRDRSGTLSTIDGGDCVRAIDAE
ncbi:hypothetical protein ABVK25_005071 [Lepraria finkii]|uniref:Uncharacterized protein n=1 Tax=Lepraria finkii TaxID=1340010 RepID=A0ABR4BBG4_9LECA